MVRTWQVIRSFQLKQAKADRNKVSLQGMNGLVDTKLMSQSRYLVRPAAFANKRITMRA